MVRGHRSAGRRLGESAGEEPLLGLSEVGADARFLVHDHDAKYGGGSDLVFRTEGIEVIRTPIVFKNL